MPEGGEFQAAIHSYYEEIAPRYLDAVEPAFKPLVQGLIDHVRLERGQHVLDVGTGSGLAARLAAPHCDSVTALDFSRGMLINAQKQGISPLVQGDMHHLPFRSQTFDVALAAFAYNSTDPLITMEETCRVLKKGGWLAMQEWGTPDVLSELLSDTIALYAVEEPPPALAARREAQQAPHPWDTLTTSEDIAAMLEDAGFDDMRIVIATPSIPLPDVETFIRYKLAWPSRMAEVDAMDDEVRALCLSDLRENLAAYATLQDQLIWQPNVVRITATRRR